MEIKGRVIWHSTRSIRSSQLCHKVLKTPEVQSGWASGVKGGGLQPGRSGGEFKLQLSSYQYPQEEIAYRFPTVSTSEIAPN